MIKRILLLLCLGIPSLIFGQNQLQPLLNMPTPQAASIGLFGKIPVNYSTGMPIIDIPLYNIKLDDIELPISCKYHLANVKPDSGFGILGTGWNLSSGGCITRNVNCLPDELSNYQSSGTQNSLDGYFKHASLVNNKNNFYTNLYCSTGATDPSFELAADEFSFNFCGYSGNFYYGSDNKWHVSSEQRIIVEFDPNTGFATNRTLADSSRIDLSRWQKKHQYIRYFNKFKIITPDGTKYYFGGVNATEYSIDYYARNNSYLIPTSWYLTKIETTKGHEINLKYKVGKPNCKINYSPDKVELYNNMPFVDRTVGDACNSGFLLFPIYLEAIDTPNEKITYSYKKCGTLKNRYAAAQLYDKKPSFLHESIFSGIWDAEFYDDYLCFLNPSKHLGEDATVSDKILSAIEWDLLNKVKIESKRNTQIDLQTSGTDEVSITESRSITHGYNYHFDYLIGYSPELTSITRRPNTKYPEIRTDTTYLHHQAESNLITPIDDESALRDQLVTTATTSSSELDVSTSTSDNEPTDECTIIVPPPPAPVTYGDTVPSNYVYSFSYHRVPTDGIAIKYHPRVRENYTDYWGYWNNDAARRYSESEKFSNQQSNETYTNFQTLSSIHYPTRGYTTFKYELHDFKYGVSPDRQSLEKPYLAYLSGHEIKKEYISMGAGLRVKSITTHNKGVNTTKTFEYKTKDNESSGILNTMPSTGSIYFIGDEALYRKSIHGFNIPTTNQNSALVNYTRVKIKTCIDNVDNGSEVYYYTSYTDSIDHKSLFDEPAEDYFPNPYKDYAPVATTSKASARFKLKKKEIYSATNKLLQTDEYEYTASPDDKNFILSLAHANTLYPTDIINQGGHLTFRTNLCCKGFLYHTYLNSYFPCKKTTKTYTQNSTKTIDTQTIYTYNKDKQLCSESLLGPNNTLLQKTEYMYPNDVTSNYLQFAGKNNRYEAYAALNNLNIITAPIAQTVIKSNKVVSCNVALYDLKDGFPVKTDDYTLEEKVDTLGFLAINFINDKEIPVNDKLKRVYSYGEFDKFHNPCYVWNDQHKIALLWGCDGQTLGIKIENIELDDLKNISNFKLGSEYVSANSIRKEYPHTQITEYNVNPFLGLTSSTDKRGIFSVFRYDTLGRLILSGSLFEKKWNIDNMFEYNYKP